MMRLDLSIGTGTKLGLKLIALLMHIEAKSAVDRLVCLRGMLLVREVSLRQRRVRSEGRSRGLSMVRPDILLTIILKRTIQTSLVITSGQLRVDVAAVEEVWVGVLAVAVGTGARADKLLVPGLASKAAGIPDTNAVGMALIHGVAPGREKGYHVVL
jgi:hypothetical protein